MGTFVRKDQKRKIKRDAGISVFRFRFLLRRNLHMPTGESGRGEAKLIFRVLSKMGGRRVIQSGTTESFGEERMAKDQETAPPSANSIRGERVWRRTSHRHRIDANWTM